MGHTSWVRWKCVITSYSIHYTKLYEKVAWCLPLTHLVALVRGCSLQLWSVNLWWSVLYLALAAALLIPLAIALMVRRIIS